VWRNLTYDGFLIIDGSFGEGGGQILRSTQSLAVITGRPVRIENIRANRKKPVLAAQHLTSVQAAAMLFDAEVKGAELGSQMLQTLLLPLALAAGVSTVMLRGGTHVDMSPSYDYVHDVWLPTFARMGVRAELSLARSGWFPVGRGEVRLRIAGSGELGLLRLEHRGPLRAVTGRALAANLPAHICERMAYRARDLLEQTGMAADIEAAVLEAACPGAGLYLTAHYENSLAGFSAQGKRGKPAERVAEAACSALLHHYRSGAALEQHLADQLILPLALCRGESVFSVERISPHLVTNAWVVERFGLARIDIAPAANGTGLVKILPSR